MKTAKTKKEVKTARIIDEAETDLTVAPTVYDIASYGADYDVRGLVIRINEGNIIVPSFQRAFVWKQTDASSFIESLLLGLPVPGIFLATEKNTNKLMVIDGQQRLKTLQFFYEGHFDPKPNEEKKKVFKLSGVQRQFADCTYESLSEKDKRRLDNSIIHATIIRQVAPRDGDTSVYHVFQRLNASGVILQPQEIRRAAYHGPFLDKITELNNYASWRSIFGKKNPRLKDEELILRFIALYFNAAKYVKPMKEFLSVYASSKQSPSEHFLQKSEGIFNKTIDIANKALGQKAFRVVRGINTALFDSVMVGLARRLEYGEISNYRGVKKAYRTLLTNKDYKKAISDGTSDELAVALRLKLATEAFSSIK